MQHVPNVEFPDATNGVPCCMGYANGGAEDCTCWRPITDPVVQAAPAGLDQVEFMGKACSDCAYKAGSPERLNKPGTYGNAELIADIVNTGAVFWCHDAMRKIVGYHHPSGHAFAIKPDAGAYVPEVRDGIPYRADGRPGAVCAGWATRRRRVLAEDPQPALPIHDEAAVAVHAALVTTLKAGR